MSSTTIPKPLSGAEVRDAIVFDIKKALSLDDRLAGHLAYDGFTYKATISISIPSAVNSSFVRELQGGRGEPVNDPEEVLVEAERALGAPNQVRLSSEQPIPVLVDDGKGHITEQYKSYVVAEVGGSPVPKQRNIVKGK